MRKLLLLSLILLSLGIAPAASALIMAQDCMALGGNQVNGCLLDTNTNLLWIQPDLTAGLSYNLVSGHFGPGGLFDGFAYASEAQWDAFRAQVLGTFGPGGSSLLNTASVSATAAMLFEGPICGAPPCATAADVDIFFMSWSVIPPISGGFDVNGTTSALGDPAGHALVMPASSSVPEPGTWVLTVVGAALLLRRWRRLIR